MVMKPAFMANKAEVEVDLSELPKGSTYEDRYRGYMTVFERIARLPGDVKVMAHSAPWSWVPLLQHLNVDIRSSVRVFNHCGMVQAAIMNCDVGLDRTALEVLCSFRPETVDALWKIDRQWFVPAGRVRTYKADNEFIVTTNGAFDRPEIKAYESALADYVPRTQNVVLVPCAADKPYPAPMHSAVLKRIPDEFYVANVTGVVGIIPQELWHIAPHYDSGIPNRWRAQEALIRYFTAHTHQRVIVFCDFYNEAISRAFEVLRLQHLAPAYVDFVLPVRFYPDYVDLASDDYLLDLDHAIRRSLAKS